MNSRTHFVIPTGAPHLHLVRCGAEESLSNMKRYSIYIVGSHSGTLYVGVTNDINRRMYEHQEKLTPGFTSKYDVTRLLYLEDTNNIQEALEREKQIKRWRRSKKERLIRTQNPQWLDLKRGYSCHFDRTRSTRKARSGQAP